MSLVLPADEPCGCRHPCPTRSGHRSWPGEAVSTLKVVASGAHWTEGKSPVFVGLFTGQRRPKLPGDHRVAGCLPTLRSDV